MIDKVNQLKIFIDICGFRILIDPIKIDPESIPADDNGKSTLPTDGNIDGRQVRDSFIFDSCNIRFINCQKFSFYS